MKLLAAFDKFKDSMSAAAACKAAARAAHEVFGDTVVVTETPLTDGGEGFCPILTYAAAGHINRHLVCGPLGNELKAPIGWVEAEKLPETARQQLGNPSGQLAIIEMASAAGLEQVPAERRHPKHCTTYGVGQLIRIASENGADAILLGIGGSATSDLGLGALEALGLEFPNVAQITPEGWPCVHSINGHVGLKIPPIYIACDVDNPLLGPNGAASIYGPQKGLRPIELPAFDAEASRLAGLLCDYFNQSQSLIDEPGSGAAGGIGFGLKVACGANYVAGFSLVKAWLDLDRKVAQADLVLSGEGRIDRSSLSGKGPYALAASAHAANKPCILLAGKVDADAADSLHQRFPRCQVFSITPDQLNLAEALVKGAHNLQSTTFKVLNTYKSDDG